MHVVKLPSAIAIHQIRSVLSQSIFFPEHPQQIKLSFHPQKTYLDPMGVALLASWASYWYDRGVPVTCDNLSSSGLAYAERMGLFRHMSVSFPKAIEKHDESGRFVELTQISTQDDLSRLCTAIGGVLRVPHLIEFVQYVLVELVRNTLEHAGSSAMVCAQYYAKDKRVTIAVVDCGCGIRESLRLAYGFQDDRSAILAAMRPGLSGTTSTPYSSPDNAGLGLFYARGVAKASARPFVLVSGSAAYKQLAKQESVMPSRSPEDEVHDLILGISPWQGTAIGINIRGFDANLKSFMARMKPLLNVGAKMKRTPSLNFT